MRSALVATLWACSLWLCAASSLAAWAPPRLLAFVQSSCQGWEATGKLPTGYAEAAAQASPINFRERRIGTRFRLLVEDNARLEFDIIERGARPSRYVGSLFNRFGDPLLLLSLDRDCELQVARQFTYSAHGQALNIVTLDDELAPRGQPDWLNPALEFDAREMASPLRHPGGSAPLRVALIDSGVNYLLPEINRRLARGSEGQLIGYDFWDMDELPFDAHPVTSGFFLQRHGTRTAALLLREAPGIELVPYRYPRPDMSRMRALVDHAVRHQVSIIGMPLGSNRGEDWGEFAAAARAHPHILFIASAGNDGRDIDQSPVYPAAFDLENLLVVTSADDFVRPAERTNWGRISVDYMVPAERLETLDFSGRRTLASGSSYAVARVTALAARLKQSHAQWRAADIIAELKRRYGGGAARHWVRIGYIADPLAGASIERIPQAAPDLQWDKPAAGYRLPLEILVLDGHWHQALVDQSLRQAFSILAQCLIVAGEVSISRIEADDYLRDLSTGSARTLLEAVPRSAATVVLARETRMQEAYLGEAFGLGNTRRRPWLTNSVWLMREVEDPGIALAHELFHVLANDGAHVDGGANLMQGRTRPDGLELTPLQCRQAQLTGVAAGLLQQ